MPTAGSTSRKTVLITGCSSGIGRAAAEQLAAAGHVVYATARSTAAVKQLNAWASNQRPGAFARHLDVTSPPSIDSVVDEMTADQGRIDVLINNAGYGQSGAVEDVSIDDWRRQFETNLFGAIRVTQACLPTMRRQGDGRIINISSVVAHVALPLMGPYCASKHALDAFSVSLRNEVAPFGLRVCLIEPGPIATRFRENLRANRGGDSRLPDSPYERIYRALEAHWKSRFGRQGKTADDVAVLVRHAVEARRPRSRYRITGVAHLTHWVLPFVPERLFDAVIRRRMRP